VNQSISSESSAAAPEPEKGLPAVQPPSGKHIVQMFVVPAIIVAGFLVILFGIDELRKWFFGVARTPAEHLYNLRSTNPDVRWRAASDLAQALKSDDELASNPGFSLELAELLREAIDDGQRDEQSFAERFAKLSKEDRAKEREALNHKWKYVLFLGSCLGNSMVPVGVPLLNEMAVNNQGADVKVVARRRWQAIWALANLGENTNRFDKLSPERQEAVLAELAREAAAGKPEWRERANLALRFLEGRRSGNPPAIGVGATLAACASDDIPFLREMTAFALTFWEGSLDPEIRAITPSLVFPYLITYARSERDLIEETLIRSTYDSGRSDQFLAAGFDDEEPGAPESRAATRKPGLSIRYQAAIALARHGSSKVRLDLLAEMLDEDLQRQNFYVTKKDGQETPDEHAAQTTLDNALKAVVKLHEKRPGLDLTALDEALERLTHSPNVAVRTEAERVRIALKN